MSQLAITSLSKSFGAFKVFENLSLVASAGEIVVIFGGSGTGKTILLRLVAGVEEATSGRIEINGEDATDIAPEHRGIGMAFQNFALFPHMSASENIATPLRAQKASEDRVKAGVARVARLLKIDHVLGHAPRELSNGQKQRTALARALAAEPKILLLDDPLRNVDAKLRFEMRLELPRLLRQSGATVLYVTQDYKEAMALADRIAVLAGGSFVQVAAPDAIYLKPETLTVARLFGDPVINTFESMVRLDGKTPCMTFGNCNHMLGNHFVKYDGHKLVMAVRPEAITLSKRKGSGLSAELKAITPLNERTVLLLQAPDGTEILASLSASDQAPNVGETMQVGFDPAGTHYFDAEHGGRIDG